MLFKWTVSSFDLGSCVFLKQPIFSFFFYLIVLPIPKSCAVQSTFCSCHTSFYYLFFLLSFQTSFLKCSLVLSEVCLCCEAKPLADEMYQEGIFVFVICWANEHSKRCMASLLSGCLAMHNLQSAATSQRPANSKEWSTAELHTVTRTSVELDLRVCLGAERALLNARASSLLSL